MFFDRLNVLLSTISGLPSRIFYLDRKKAQFRKENNSLKKKLIETINKYWWI